MRNNSTQAEIKLWMYLRNKKMNGYDFHRQKPIDEYILDFFCNELMLGIEVDGFTHLSDETIRKDIEKERRMNDLGITVLRFTDEEVLKQIQYVLTSIESSIKKQENQTNTPLPLSRGENTQ